MKKSVLFLLFCCSIIPSSCGLVELDDSRVENHAWISSVPDSGNLYAVGVDYPEDYDWRSDPEHGQVKCSLVVWMDGRVVMRIAAEDKYEVSADPDCFRFIGKCLYTDFSTAEETVVKANGEELFRYQGREMIAGFAVEGNDVYTLGNSRDGMGFSFRKNGEVIFQDAAGTAYPHLLGQEGKYTFCYFSFDIGESGRKRRRHFMFDGDSPVEFHMPRQVYYLTDALVRNGRFMATARFIEDDFPVLLDGGDLLCLEGYPGYERRGGACKLQISPSGECYTYGSLGNETAAAWCGQRKLFSRTDCDDVIGLKAFGNLFVCYLLGHGEGEDSIVCGDRFWRVPEGYRALGTVPVGLWQGKVYAALTPSNPGKPVIWCEGKVKEVDIHGCLYDIGVSD